MSDVPRNKLWKQIVYKLLISSCALCSANMLRDPNIRLLKIVPSNVC